MEVQEDFYRNKALAFKTPAKRKRTLDEDTFDLVIAAHYSPLFKDDEDLVLGDLSEVSGMLSRFHFLRTTSSNPKKPQLPSVHCGFI
jgi:hypothetical protein